VKILLVEDDDSLIAVLSKTLTAHHFVVDVVKDGEAGWNYGSTFEYDLIVLDIMLPKLDGISLCQRFRSERFSTPILLLTAQDNSTAKVKGLDAGADDYIVKPFDLAELLARIRALLRRSSTNPLPLLTWGDLLLNPSTCEVTYQNRPLKVTTKEYELLELFLRHSDRVFSTDEILDRLWSSDKFPAEATVRSHIRRLRHILTTNGAPRDLISTVRGHGYYLKAPTRSNLSTTLSLNHPTEQQLQYLEFLDRTWTITKPESLAKLTLLSQAAQDLEEGKFDLQSQQQARQIAHKLAGTLGLFGLKETVQLARELEQLMSGAELLRSHHLPTIKNAIERIQEQIEQTFKIELSHLPCERPPQLLIIDLDKEFCQALVRVASKQGIEATGASTITAAQTWLVSQSAMSYTSQRSYGIILRLPDRQSKERDLLLQWLEELTQRYAHLPILIISDRQELPERLEILRRGGKILVDSSITPEQAIATMMQLLSNVSEQIKVTIVDDDIAWLKAIPKLLEPWGFKVTTLADPHQFWTVLETLEPDVLVLDINMPAIDGLELCQILRSDPHWQKLPVLFLSALSDSTTQNQAFRAGADDYLCKPVMGIDLANRIINRLQRVRVCTS
jgi:DNA-binding response OmpR family regulator/HPt (histidine-containing phosphotransfer) domain-containing protein